MRVSDKELESGDFTGRHEMLVREVRDARAAVRKLRERLLQIKSACENTELRRNEPVYDNPFGMNGDLEATAEYGDGEEP